MTASHRREILAGGAVAMLAGAGDAPAVPRPDPDPSRSPEALLLEPNGWVPNNPALPVLVYRNVVPADADAIEALFCDHRWRPDWRWTVYPFHHYHSTGHEAVACFAGSAELMLGGENGRHIHVGTGDVLVLPAGTGHCCLNATDGFQLVGAYPDGQHVDLLRGPADAATLARIAAVPLPPADPVTGRDGPLMRLWGTD